MNKWIFLLIGSLSLYAGQCNAQDLCRSLCSSEKKECRIKADQDTKLEIEPLIRSTPEHYPSKNPNQVPQYNSDEIREMKSANYQKSKTEKYKICDDQSMRCIAQCMNSSSPMSLNVDQKSSSATKK